jgi:hypothetical protein
LRNPQFNCDPFLRKTLIAQRLDFLDQLRIDEPGHGNLPKIKSVSATLIAAH